MSEPNFAPQETGEVLKAGDELSLLAQDIVVPEVPEDILFPDELNRYLRERVQHLTQQNGMLQANLNECEERLQARETQVGDLGRKLSEFQSAKSNNGFALAANTSCTKIAELSKKLRERNSVVEAFKTKCSKLEKVVRELTEKQQEEKDTTPDKCVSEKDESPKLDKVKVLQEKLTSTNMKLFDVKNQNMQLKSDLKLATRLLQQEIGESFENLQGLVNTNSNWKGRAQVICDLQQKVAELKEKLAKDKREETNESRAATGRCRIERRSEILTNENRELKQSLDEWKKRSEAAKARCKVLEVECSNIRSKLSAMSNQNEKDHELITSLMGQMSHLRDDHLSALKQKERIIEKLEQNVNNLKNELAKERDTNENLLRDMNTAKEERQISSESVPEWKSYNAAISKLEAEKLRLLELLEVISNRLEKEREAHAETQLLFRTERQKAAKFEAKIAKLQLENSDRNSVYSVHSTLNRQMQVSLEDQLELAGENIKALQTRLELEKQERKMDFREFSKILQNSGHLEQHV